MSFALKSSPLPSVVDERIVVGIGELGVSNNPTTTLSLYGLGSCVGIAAYDPIAKAGGLIHIMLPCSAIDRKKAAEQPAMFADTGLPLLFETLGGLPTDRNRLRFLVAGGAAILRAPDDFNLGVINARAALEYLKQHNPPVCHTEIGGTANRTLHFAVGTGMLTLRTETGATVFSLAM